MPVATDSLNEDIKELKGDIRDIRGDLDVLKADVHRIDVGLAELRAEFRSALAVGKWAVSLVVGVILTVGVTSSVAAVWWASSITGDVKHMEARFDKLEAAVIKGLDQAKPQPIPSPKAN